MRAPIAVGLDLLEISPNAEPPVVKILDFGKFKYEQQKKKNEAKKKQKVIEIKEIKVRPNIDENDYQVKLRAMKSFIEEGDKVKVTLRFRGREMAHQDIGVKVLERIRADMDTADQGGADAADGKPADGDGADAALNWAEATRACPHPAWRAALFPGAFHRTGEPMPPVALDGLSIC